MNLRNRVRDVEFRATDSDPGDGRTLSGYAAVFSVPTRIREAGAEFIETIAPGAFAKTLRERGKRVAMQWSHGRDPRVGQFPIGVFTELREDRRGLRVTGRLLDTEAGRDVAEAIRAGAVQGMSFSFEVLGERWTDAAGKRLQGDEVWRLLASPGNRGPLRRSITEVRLLEAGPVLMPAYEATTVGVRSHEHIITADQIARLADNHNLLRTTQR